MPWTPKQSGCGTPNQSTRKSILSALAKSNRKGLKQTTVWWIYGAFVDVRKYLCTGKVGQI